MDCFLSESQGTSVAWTEQAVGQYLLRKKWKAWEGGNPELRQHHSFLKTCKHFTRQGVACGGDRRPAACLGRARPQRVLQTQLAWALPVAAAVSEAVLYFYWLFGLFLSVNSFYYEGYISTIGKSNECIKELSLPQLWKSYQVLEPDLGSHTDSITLAGLWDLLQLSLLLCVSILSFIRHIYIYIFI